MDLRCLKTSAKHWVLILLYIYFSLKVIINLVNLKTPHKFTDN